MIWFLSFYDHDSFLEEVTVEPFQHVLKSSVEVWDSSGQSVPAKADPIPKKKSTHRPSFMEEIMEDTDTSSEIVEIGVCMQGWVNTDVNKFFDWLWLYLMFLLGLLSDLFFF